MIDKSPDNSESNNSTHLLDKLNDLINYGNKNIHRKNILKRITGELELLIDPETSACYPALIDIVSLINESANKSTATDNKINFLKNLLDKVLQNISSYIKNPESGQIKDNLICSLQELDHDYLNNKQISMLREMLDIFNSNISDEEEIFSANDIVTREQNDGDNQIQQYTVNQGLPRETREILEIMITEYLSVDQSIKDILELIDNGNKDLLNKKLEEILLSYTYYSDAVRSMGYDGLSAIINHLILNINETRKNNSSDFGSLFNILENYTDIILHYLQDPYDTENKIHILESIKNLKLPVSPAQTEINKINEFVNSLIYPDDKKNDKNEPDKKITDDDVSLVIADDTDKELLNALLNELPIQIEDLNNSMQNIFENYNTDHILAAKRIAHTLKGSANTVGIRGIASMTHHLEDILLNISKRNTKPDDGEKAVIQAILDCLSEMSDAVLGMGPEPTDAINVLQQALDLAHQLQTDGNKNNAVTHSNTIDTNKTAKSDRVENNSFEQVSMVRVPGDFIDYLLRMSGESMIVSRRLQNQVLNIKDQLNETRKYFELLNNLNNRLEKIVDIKDLTFNKKQAMDETKYDSLEMDNYNELHICSKHLVEVSSDIDVISQQIKSQLDNLNNTILKQLQINNEAQEAIFRARLMPANTLSTRLQRCVRQAAKLINKNVQLTITGGETLIDGEILNELLEPLSHIIRNAVDHGIEDARVREEYGKSESGNIELHFEVDGNNINIRCSDDGAGLDFESIQKKAVSEGLLSGDQMLTDEELSKLIFKPGFTTKKDTTHISGRGIGMDAVYTSINKLSGTIKIASHKYSGTTIEIKLPQNLQKIYGLVVSVGQDNIVLANRDIYQIIYNENVKILNENDKDYIIYNKNKYSARYLESLLHIDVERRQKSRFTTSSIFYKTANETTAIIVQKILSSNYFIVKKLSEYIPKLTGILGVTILDNGKVTPVIDLAQFINNPLSENKKVKKALKHKKTGLPKAVVVDDSLTARKSLVQFMEDSGFQVRSARDGVEAIEIIKFYQPDIVITDLEMPEMNGIELTNHIRSTESISSLPVIMVTSRALEKHKEEAINSGINAYIIKPYSETQLMETIKDLFKTKSRSVHN